VRLHELEGVIERGLSSFVEVGQALMEIRDGELYREAGFGGFVEYLEAKPWGIGRSRAYQMIDAATVSTVVETNERQARELVPLLRKATPEVVRQVYAEVVQETANRPTAPAIREKVQEVLSSENGGKAKRKHSRIDAELEHHLSEIKRLIPRWESRFVDSHSAKDGRRRVQLAEDIAAWLTDEYVPAHAALVTPLARVPT
jgi:hypothetical protein